MPELAEVEYYRKQWNCGLDARIEAVAVHPASRVFRGLVAEALSKHLRGAVLLGSETHGKQMMFRFSNEIWLGLHLGMTGELRVEAAGFRPTEESNDPTTPRSRTMKSVEFDELCRVTAKV